MKCQPVTPDVPALMPTDLGGRQSVHHYIGQGAEAERLIESAVRQQREHMKKCDAFNLETVKADQLHKHRGHILGFCFDVDPNEQPAALKGLKHARRERVYGVYDLAVDLYKPDRSTHEGQALIERIRAIGGFCPHEWIRGELGLDLLTQTQSNAMPSDPTKGPWLLNTSILYEKRTLYVQIPELPNVTMPRTPKWFKKVLAGEFYAHMEDDQSKKVRK